ncbi:NAD(P)H-binding protein [soil metagenome]
MKVGVLGATGTAGRPVVAELTARGHEVVSLGRRPARAAEHRQADVVSGAGLDTAFEGLDAVAECLNANSTGKKARAVLVDGVARALAAAGEAGVGHAVSLSIVGCDRLPMAYYAVKTEQEATVRAAPLETSILRATQFHDLIDAAGTATKRTGVLPCPRGSLQPIDPKDMAKALADQIERGPGGDCSVGGPEIVEIRELARIWREARGSRRPPVSIPSIGGALKALAGGVLTDSSAPRGEITWERRLTATKR